MGPPFFVIQGSGAFNSLEQKHAAAGVFTSAFQIGNVNTTGKALLAFQVQAQATMAV